MTIRAPHGAVQHTAAGAGPATGSAAGTFVCLNAAETHDTFLNSAAKIPAMASISENAISPLRLLLEATLFPERAVTKVQRTNKLQEDEIQDAIHHRAVLWDQLLYEWAVHDGQIDLHTVINGTGASLKIKTDDFGYALMEVGQYLDLECSFPIDGTDQQARRMRPWKGQRCSLVERTRWVPIHILPEERSISIEEWDHSKSFGQTSLPKQRIGHVWVRVTPECKKHLEANLLAVLRNLSKLIGEEHSRLRRILVQQQSQLSESEAALLNSHLNGAWESIVGSIPRYITSRKKAKLLTAEEKNGLAKWGIRKLCELLRKEGDELDALPAQKVFISYSRADTSWLEKLLTMMSPLQRTGVVSVWYDRAIRPSQIWRTEIKQAMESAAIAVLLVSDNFLASDFINESELPFLLNAAKEKGVFILWVAVTPSGYKHTPLEEIGAANDPARPLDSFHRSHAQKQELLNICNHIHETARAAAMMKRSSTR